MIDVTILLLEDSHSSTAVGPLEVFGAAGTLWQDWQGAPVQPRFRTRTVTMDGKPVRGYGALKLSPDGPMSSVRKTDLILVPSAGTNCDGTLKRSKRIISWLQRWHKRGASIAGVCSGVLLLAEAGLLDGRVGTTHWALAGEFQRRYPKVDWQPHLFVTESDGVFCGGGVNSSFDLSLYLVEKFCGYETALQCAQALLIEMPRTSHADFSVLPLAAPHSDEAVRRAEKWIHQNVGGEFQLQELAGKLGMSPRTFIRRFKAATGHAPLVYLQKLRVGAAKRKLEIASNTVEQVGREVGYEDTAFFRNIFKRNTGMTPNAYRQRFGSRALLSKSA